MSKVFLDSIDILTKRGTHSVFDTSANESLSSWKVYTPENRKERVDAVLKQVGSNIYAYAAT